MDIDFLIKTFADQPVVESSSIITLVGNAKAARVQISRWVASGRLIQLKRGYYLLPPPYRKMEPDIHYVANILCAPSYVSLVYALGYYGMIPEAVVAVTSVTTRRPQKISTPIGRFEYRHVIPRLFWGFDTKNPLGVMPVQIALPEKALLDLIYFTAGDVDEKFFESIRLQHTDIIDMDRMRDFASKFGGRKMIKAVKVFSDWSQK